MEVTLKKAFSLLDGRLSTEIVDVYEMLNYIYSDNLMIHQLPTAMKNLEDLNPQWFSNGVDILNDIKRTNKTDDFIKLMELIDSGFPTHKIKLEKLDEKIDAFAGLLPNSK